jgi:hypothetical protein
MLSRVGETSQQATKRGVRDVVSHVEKAAPPFSGSELWALPETMIRAAQIAPPGEDAAVILSRVDGEGPHDSGAGGASGRGSFAALRRLRMTGKTYLMLTLAPASSKAFLIFSASSFETPSLTV